MITFDHQTAYVYGMPVFFNAMGILGVEEIEDLFIICYRNNGGVARFYKLLKEEARPIRIQSDNN